MSNFRTMVIYHTDSLGNPYTTRVITDFPEEVTASYLEKATALYESLDLGVVSVVKVEETEHAIHHGADVRRESHKSSQGSPAEGVQGMGASMFGRVAVRLLTARPIRPKVAFGGLGLLLVANLALGWVNSNHLERQDAILQAAGYRMGLDGVQPPKAEQLNAAGWTSTRR